MQVTFHGFPNVQSTLDKRLLLLAQLLQVFRYLPIHRLGDHRRRLGANPGHFRPASLLLMVEALLLAQPGYDVCGAAVGTYPIGIGTRALQQVSDLPQGLYWIHSDRLRRGRGLS